MFIRPSMLALSLVACGFVSVAAQADVLNDDFNGYVEDADFTATSDWDQVGDFNANIILTADDDESPFSAVSDGLAARYQDASNGGGAGEGFGIGFAAQDPTQPFFVDFDFKITSFDTNDIIPTFNLVSGNDAKLFLRLFAKDANGDAFLGNRTNAGTELLTGAPVALDSWYHVSLAIDPVNTDSDTYSVTFTPFGGAPVTVEDLPFRANTGSIDGLQFTNNGANNQDGAYVIDNVRVYVPEPGSLCLLAPAAAALLARRRRHAA